MSPFRLDEFRAKVQFLCSARLPSLIHKASVVTDTPSNTVYIQRAVCKQLSIDLGIPLAELLAEQPPTRTRSGELRGHRHTGPANTVEEVR